jgi:hypothetical protein
MLRRHCFRKLRGSGQFDAITLLPNVAASMFRRFRRALRQSNFCRARTLAQKTALLARGAFELQAVLVLLVLLGVAYAAGYFTRERISRRRRERAARGWRNGIDPEQPQAANTNQTPLKGVHGDLAQMLNRWEDRARVRRSQR